MKSICIVHIKRDQFDLMWRLSDWHDERQWKKQTQLTIECSWFSSFFWVSPLCLIPKLRCYRNRFSIQLELVQRMQWSMMEKEKKMRTTTKMSYKEQDLDWFILWVHRLQQIICIDSLHSLRNKAIILTNRNITKWRVISSLIFIQCTRKKNVLYWIFCR